MRTKSKRMYECVVTIGRRPGRKLYCRSAEWIGDSIVINFSDERSLVDSRLAECVHLVAFDALNCSRKVSSVVTSLAEEFNIPMPDVHADYLREYGEKYGYDALLELVYNVWNSREEKE